ncbi:MAG: hypothetical protein ABSD62_12015 [Candidatus Limnocylindrales bacterium]
MRREAVLVGALAVAVVLAAATLGAAFLMAKADHDWATVATVNGHSISREALRARVSVVGFLAQERYSFLGTKLGGGFLTSGELPGLESQASAPLADPVNAARESLIDDELTRELAAREGVATPAAPDPWAEARAYVTSDLAHQVRLVRFGLPSGASTAAASGSNPWPAAASTNIAAATERLRTELAADTRVETIVAGLHDAGWDVFGEEVAVSATGAPADASLALDPEIALAAGTAGVGDLLGPATDEYGRVSMARVLTPADTSRAANVLPGDAETTKVDSGALADWANAQALRRALSAALLKRWKTKGVTLAHFRELVIGDAPTSSGTAGPWVELSGLAIDRLASLNPTAIAGAPTGLDLHADPLAKTMRELSASDRTRLFGALVSAANAAPGPDASKASGEVGFAAKDGLIPDLAKAAFDARVKTGDILGPITTSAGPQLFLVEARFSGALDDRAQAALREVRLDASPDPLAYTTRFSPADAALARDAGWRADAEFGADEDVRHALFDTPLGSLSDPFVLDGKLACAIVDARSSGTPSARTAARLSLDRFDAWYHGERIAATITRSDNPLPELASPTPSPTLALPSMPGLETPALPTIPGQPAATPVKTDELGLPALP